MYFRPEVDERDLPGILSRYVELSGGIRVWEQRKAVLDRQVRDNPLVQSLFNKRYWLEHTILSIIRRRNTTRRLRVELADYAENSAASLMTLLTRVYDHLPEKGRRRLRGMLTDAENEFARASEPRNDNDRQPTRAGVQRRLS